MGPGEGGRSEGCSVSGCSMIVLLTLREEMAKAGAGDSAAWCNSAKIIDSNRMLLLLLCNILLWGARSTPFPSHNLFRVGMEENFTPPGNGSTGL